jgi:hypothetical protein
MTLLRVQPLEDRIVLDGAIAHDVSAVIAPVHPAGGDPHALVIVANNIVDSHSLQSNVSQEKASVLAYDYNGNNLNSLSSKINEALGDKKVNSIAIVTDGADGQFNLVNGLQVNASTLESQPVKDFLHALTSHLTSDGSINILGCNVAQDSAGLNFLTSLTKIINSQGTHFTVNASSDPTGSSALGGNWILEYTSNPDGKPVDASQLYMTDGTQNSWDHVLMPAVNVTPTTGLVTTAHGGSASFSVSLNSQPTTSITLDFAISNSSEGTFIDSSGHVLGATEAITFTTSDWLIPKTLYIKGLSSGTSGPNDTYSITSTIRSSTDPNYNPAMTIPSITVTYVSQDTNPYIQTRVWNDVNANGFQDPGEPGVGNQLVYLVNDATSTIYGQQFTDSTGNTVFSNVPVGSYHLYWTLPQASTTLPQFQIYGGVVSVFDSDALGLGTFQGRQVAMSSPITVVAGTNVNHVDAGYVLPLGTLSTHVWQDTNANGIWDSGEGNVAGLNVILHNTANNNEMTSLTNTLGYATFANVPAGSYILEWQLPNGSTYTLPNIAINGNFNSQAITSTLIGSTNFAQSAAFSVINGQSINNVNAYINASNGLIYIYCGLIAILRNGIVKLAILQGK